MDLETIYINKVENLVKKSITGPPGTPDWSSILQILSIFDSQPGSVPIFLTIICKYISKGTFAAKQNSLILVDALFKNSKRQQLQSLQSPVLMKHLSQPGISENPALQNFLYKTTPSWINSCTSQNCLDPKFSKWQQSQFSTHFVPKLTRSIKKKFYDNISASMELLVMFSQCIIASFADGGTEEGLLKEMIPNVREIARRLCDLEPTIVDPDLRNALRITHDFCDFCQQTFGTYKKTKEVNTNDVVAAATKAQNKLNAIISKKKEPKEKEITKKKKEKNDLTVEEFFAELDKLKSNNNSVDKKENVEQEKKNNNEDLLSLIGF
ncbi:hypothetical protein GPJ56_002915 [Histomonas meleagridis]|uniref:uncharacterized protein n=1 Tax=Histomonas meleagridis TaxID=135588 RepID=UPI003559C4A3|nr:hypothetical protein GPJ56_002915 [Histomonas meleagridis]KAH0800384.1 hypothetical protein GO595_006795 [Histomonas meleagridis]